MAPRRAGLGKGLNALIPGGSTPPPSGGGPFLVEIAVRDLSPNPHQPRVHFDEESLDDLSASIREIGVLQPLLVRQLPDGAYQLIAGERRWRAAQRAGLSTVPCVVKTTDDMSSVEQALVENLHRQDLSPLEEASAYQQLLDDFKLTHDEVAKRVGKSRSSVTNTLRLLNLPPAVQALLADGRLSAGHAKALLGTADRAFQEQIARRAATEQWSVRAVEEAVRDRETTSTGTAATKGTGGGTAGGSVARSLKSLSEPALLEVGKILEEYLATRVALKMANNKGTITIEFADINDLERVYRLITEGPN